ncbi:glycoside hydrolase family 61 protein-like protein [Dendryphion nanum]|uniref:AA9 family lytic polysaccharide monooxygenase n=1 Tax=Dendryphion nanum TaxID=256645 RepID=A0A9P9D4K5_9PLEO|nr:glycoside hydrolase family 61 protein-like protein [Dendryphion nanum]
MWHIYASIAGYLAHHVAAHGGAANYTIGETWYPGYDPYGPTDQDGADYIVQRKWVTNEPIFETTNLSLPCNFPGNPAKAYIPIKAGENLTAIYYSWVHTVGPMVAWLTPCTNGDCATFDPTGADWFKIGEKGLLWGDIETGGWFQKEFSKWDGSPNEWSEKIPESLRPGKYLVRHEIISLHSANKPQFYPECANLEIKGAGTAYPGKEYLAKIPGVWSMDQPEININIYLPEVSNRTDYKIPGPPVWTG